MNLLNMKLKKALNFSENKHGSQMYGDLPYMKHIYDVVYLAKDLGYNEEIQVACALHDVLEDTDTTPNEIIKNFGRQTFETVWGVTDAEGESRKQRKKNTYPRIKSSWKSTVVKILDRVSNIKSCIEYDNIKKLEMYRKEHKEMFKSVKSKNHSSMVLYAWIEYGKYFSFNKDKSYRSYMELMSNQ